MASKGTSDADDSDSDEVATNLGWLLSIASVAILIVFSLLISHFFLGIDIAYVSAQNVLTASYWGQFGDFVGGILNPLLSFFALVAVLASLKSQGLQLKAARSEARSARKEAEAAQRIQREQSRLFERQNFESGFFNLLDLHSKSVSKVIFVTGGRKFEGQEALAQLSSKYSDFGNTIYPPWDISTEEEKATSFAEEFLKDNESRIGALMRTVSQTFIYIDSFGKEKLPGNLEPILATLQPETLVGIDGSKVYADIYSSSLTGDELHLIMLYCLTVEGSGLKKLCERYGTLKYIPEHEGSKFLISLFSPKAFK